MQKKVILNVRPFFKQRYTSISDFAHDLRVNRATAKRLSLNQGERISFEILARLCNVLEQPVENILIMQEDGNTEQ